MRTTDSRTLLRTLVPRPLRVAVQSCDLALQCGAQRVFERRLGVATGGHSYLDEADLDADGRAFYEGCHWLPLHRALGTLRTGRTDVFADLGCGMGQGVLVAARRPFRQVWGIELDPSLAWAAASNVDSARRRLRCSDVRILATDVLAWTVPADLSVVFMYCPFMGEIFFETMRRLFDSYDRRPRPLHLFYAYPWEHDWLIGTGRVVVEDVVPAQWPAKPWWWRSGFVLVRYRVVGPGEGGPGVPAVRRQPFRPRRALVRWGGANRHLYKLVRPGHETLYSRPPP